MRKTQSSPCFLTTSIQTPIATTITTPRRVSVRAIEATTPPTPQTPLLEHIDTMIPATLYQFAQCMEMYGRPEDMLKAPALVEDTFKSELACMVTPDEPPERPMESLRSILNSYANLRSDNSVYLSERFERLFSVIRRRRRMTI